jgi:hypothetical protein
MAVIRKLENVPEGVMFAFTYNFEPGASAQREGVRYGVARYGIISIGKTCVGIDNHSYFEWLEDPVVGYRWAYYVPGASKITVIRPITSAEIKAQDMKPFPKFTELYGHPLIGIDEWISKSADLDASIAQTNTDNRTAFSCIR